MNTSKKDNNYKISQYDQLVIDIRNNLTTRLADLMSKLLNSAQEKLFTLSNEADNNEDQTRYFDLMNQIRTLKPEIAVTFDTKIKEYLIPAQDFEAKKKKNDFDEDSELSLVAQDEMEGIVLVKGIGERAAAKYREQLSHLEARLEHLALKTSIVFAKEALQPTNFCQAFDDALAKDFDTDNKKILFSMFDAEVANRLDALYDSVNNRMIDAGVLPQIKLHLEKQKASVSRPKPQQPSAENTEGSEQDNYTDEAGGGAGAGGGGGGFKGTGAGGSAGGGSNINGFAMSAAPGGSYHHANQSALQSQSSENATAGVAQSGEAPQGGGAQGGVTQGGNAPGGDQTNRQNPAAEAGEYQHYTAGMPASQVGRVLGNYIGAPFTPETADKSSKTHAEFFPASTPQYFGHQEIIQALSSLQDLPQFDHPEGERFDGEAIKQAVLAEIAKKSGGAITKRINTIAEKTIDFIELIFDAIIDDEEISDAIKTLLLRLQIPIIKASMSDQQFFIYDEHPARLLLDVIADAGVGITDHSDDMYVHLDKIISNILGEHDLTTETFQHALDSLNAIIEKEESIARSKEEEEQLQILRKHARATVLKSLRATTTGKLLPETVHPLILKRWPTLMFNHYLSNGKENNEWINLVLTLRHIVESVQPLKSAEDLAKLISEKDMLLEQTEKYLNASSTSKKDVQHIIGTYEETMQSHIDDANFTENEISVAEEIIKAEPVEEPPIEEEEPANKPTLPSSIVPGMWFQVYMGEGHVARRCKLSVIIVEDANLMFVNHKGELITEKSFDELNDEIASNKSKVIMGHSAFDYAFKAVIDRLD